MQYVRGVVSSRAPSNARHKQKNSRCILLLSPRYCFLPVHVCTILLKEGVYDSSNTYSELHVVKTFLWRKPLHSVKSHARECCIYIYIYIPQTMCARMPLQKFLGDDGNHLTSDEPAVRTAAAGANNGVGTAVACLVCEDKTNMQQYQMSTPTTLLGNRRRTRPENNGRTFLFCSLVN